MLFFYNRHKARTGHVFEGRYKGIPVQDERYLISVVRYIHRNPVNAKMCNTVKDYLWSSDKYYRKRSKDFVNCDLLLGILSDDRQKAIQKYNRLMEIEEDKDLENVAYIGDESFGKQLYLEKTIVRKPLDEILIDTGVNSTDLQLIKRGSRIRRLLPYKVAYAITALQQGYSMEEIGKHIAVSSSAVCQWLK